MSVTHSDEMAVLERPKVSEKQVQVIENILMAEFRNCDINQLDQIVARVKTRIALEHAPKY